MLVFYCSSNNYYKPSGIKTPIVSHSSVTDSVSPDLCRGLFSFLVTQGPDLSLDY